MSSTVMTIEMLAPTFRNLAAPLLLLAAATSLAQDAPDKELFVSYGCYQCHGLEGQGGAALRIAPSPYPFEAFAALVRRPPNEMPAYPPGLLDEEDLRSIYRYVRTMEEPPPLEELPLLR